MTAHDPRVTLTEAEQDALIRAVTNPDDSCVHNVAPLMRAVERIIAARLAPIRALADLWTSEPSTAWWGEGVRAALDAPVRASQDHDGAEGQGEGERAGDRRCQTCGAPESNHPYRHPFKAWQPGRREATR